MLLILTTSYCWTVNVLEEICFKKSMQVFRLNFDRYCDYKFLFRDDQFEIINAQGVILHSHEITHVVSYKARLPIEEAFPADIQIQDAKWVRSTLNYIVYCIERWAIQHSCLKLWTPYECLYPKSFQMDIAKKYFSVPPYNIHWGFLMESKDVIVKSLIARPFDNKGFLFAKVRDVNSLSPKYPWLTQEVADGNRDATVLYINGKIHTFQFAEERNKLTDWRVTQGTDKNRWVAWNADLNFKNKVRAYMTELGLKFGRLDFIIGGEAPQFLEVNPCGQFGWLDDEEQELHQEVANAIFEPSSIITL